MGRGRGGKQGAEDPELQGHFVVKFIADSLLIGGRGQLCKEQVAREQVENNSLIVT